MRTTRRILAAIATALALALGLTAAPATAQPPQPSPVWDATRLHDIQFTVDQTDFTTMVQHYLDTGDKEWIEADVTIDGRTFPRSGVRLKGNSSLWGVSPTSDPTTLPWLIRLDKYTEQDLDGYQRFIVRTNYTPTALNEALALRLLEHAGLNTTRHLYTAFSVNGGAPVLRLVIQELDKTFDHEQFPAPDGTKDGGTLYKKEWDVDFAYLGTDPDDYDGAWEPTGGDEDNWQPLFDFLDWLNNATDTEFAAELDTRIDTEAFATYLAVQDLIRNWDDIDGPGQNGYFRWSPDTGRMTVVPWDHNLSFGILPAPPRPAQDDIDTAQRTTWGCPCVERALAVPAFRTLYEQTFHDLKTELYDSGLAQTLLDELTAPLRTSSLVTDANIDRDRAQIQQVFTQNITPRTGGGAPDPDQPDDCTAAITVTANWGSGWQGNLQITAGTTALNGWRLQWTWPTGQTITNHWNATLTTNAATVTATDAGWNAAVAAGRTIDAWGFIATGTPATPTVTCTAT